MPPYQYSQLVETMCDEPKPKDRVTWRGVACALGLAVFVGVVFGWYF